MTWSWSAARVITPGPGAVLQGYSAARGQVLGTLLLGGVLGAPCNALRQGYAPLLAGLVLRETFSVPLPDGPFATRTARTDQPVYVGASEAQIAFALDFGGWLGARDALACASLRVQAFPQGAVGVPYDATTALVQASTVVGSLAVLLVHGACAQTSYVVTVSARTISGRTLECSMPPIWCAD